VSPRSPILLLPLAIPSAAHERRTSSQGCAMILVVGHEAEFRNPLEPQARLADGVSIAITIAIFGAIHETCTNSAC